LDRPAARSAHHAGPPSGWRRRDSHGPEPGPRRRHGHRSRAGVAGLATAWELERLGYRVEVLEGSGRLGGRVYTHRFGTGPGAPVAELGAMRIPAGHRRVLDYVDRLGLAGELRPFRGLRPEPVLLPPPGPHAAESRLVGARLTAMVDAVAPPPVRQDVRRDLHAGLLDRLDRLDLRPYASAPDGVHALLAAHPELRSASRCCWPRPRSTS
jgi:hypothetical protein